MKTVAHGRAGKGRLEKKKEEAERKRGNTKRKIKNEDSFRKAIINKRIGQITTTSILLESP